jgi:hypothetical protein
MRISVSINDMDAILVMCIYNPKFVLKSASN